MPSDEMVEKALAAWDSAWADSTCSVPGEGPMWQKEAMRAALTAAMGEEKPVAQIVSAYGDPAAFAEREIRILRDIQPMAIGTKLFAHPSREDVVEECAQVVQRFALAGRMTEHGMAFGPNWRNALVTAIRKLKERS